MSDGAAVAVGGTFQGADVDALDRVVDALRDAADRVAAILAAVQALIIVLRAAAWFTGGASQAYAEHLRTVVAPWLRQVHAALEAAGVALSAQAAQQRDASAALDVPAYRTPALPAGDCRVVDVAGGAPGWAPVAGEDDALPPIGTDPTAVTAFFGRLSGEDAARLADRHPSHVGRLDGAPGWIRDRANRHLLGPAIAERTAERAQLIDRANELARTGDHDERRRVLRRIEDVEAGIVALRRIDRDGDLQVLVLDRAGDRIAVAVGDVDRADHVATVVPGTFARLGNFESYLARADDVRFVTQQAAGRTSVATVAWLDYDAPPSLVAAMSPRRAIDGAEGLARFTDGLVATNPDARRALLGHSYGATIVGEAASRYHLDVDTVVGIGAPGMRVTSVDQFRLPDDARVYAVTDRVGAPWNRDPIRLAEGSPLTAALGAHPGRIGADTFDVSDADAHDLERYVHRDTRAGRNLGAVVAGGDPEPRP